MASGKGKDDNDVVISGIGLVTGLGATRRNSWTAIKAGQSGVRTLVSPANDDDSKPIGCPAATDLTGPFVPEPIFALLDATLLEAIEDAGDPILQTDRDRIGVLIGLSKGCVRSLGESITHQDGVRFQASWPNAGASRVARIVGASGPCSAPVAACATGLVSVLQGVELIRRDLCDVVIAGSVDASLEPLILGAFRSMRVLARSHSPDQAVRPWDRARSGFVVGEGGAILILERAGRARARGARPYATVLGGALGGDAYHETAVNPDPKNLASLILRATKLASIETTRIDYINVHGTATRIGDPAECRAIRQALGSQADRVVCSANKSQIGHLLGAAGSAELAITCLALRDGFVPPTLNLTHPDPACDLDGTPLVGRSLPIETALKLSIGFGGHLAAALVRRFADE